MKAFLAGSACALALLSGTAYGQIATVDVNSVANLKQMIESVQQLKSQLRQMQRQYDAVTGSTGMGRIGGDSAYDAARKFPENWDEVYGNNNPYEARSERTLESFDRETDDMSPEDALKFTHDRLRLNNAHDRAVMQKVYDDQQAEMTALNQLQREIEQASTQKEISDLQARISVSQATINAQQMRMQNMGALQASQRRIYEDQERRAFMRRMVGDDDSSVPESPSITGR